jgi:hypothetical protein
VSAPSNIAAVTLGIQQLIIAAMPPKVEVSTLPPVKAQIRALGRGLLARVNVAFYQASADPTLRNSPPNKGTFGTTARQLPRPVLHYLITVYGTALPAQEQSTERLLEAAYGAIHSNPVLTFAALAQTLPDATGMQPNLTAAITEEALSPSDLELLFSAMRAEYRPTLAYRVRLSTE